jgi:tRNA modification GTPase
MLIGNKCDLMETTSHIEDFNGFRHIMVSAKQETGVQVFIEAITAHAGFQPEEDTFIARIMRFIWIVLEHLPRVSYFLEHKQ